MAIRKNCINKNRNKLQNVIPLNTPYVIGIDPSNMCNFKCSFCAVHNSKNENLFKKEKMNINLYKKIIDDIADFPEKVKILRITGFGEPTMNENLPDMINYAKQKNIAEYIEIITNGSLLNKDFSRRLIKSGVDRIKISIEALDSKGYEQICGVNIDFNKMLDNIKYLYNNSENCEIYIKIVDVSIKTNEEKKLFYKLFSDKCTEMFIENISPIWSDFEITDLGDLRYKNGLSGQKIQNVKVCPYVFYSMYINTNGDVINCCSDWKRKLVLGNVKKTKLKEIWEGDVIKNFWKDMLEGKKYKYEMCSKCLYPNYNCNDNIDEYAEEILNKLK